jgi:hypothetical protein
MTTKMTSAFSRYFSALNNLDQAAYVACFSDNAELRSSRESMSSLLTMQVLSFIWMGTGMLRLYWPR